MADYKVLKDFEFKDLGGGEWELSKYVGFDESDVEIPAQIEEKKIVSIGEKVFFENNYLKNVRIAAGIRHIGANAFYHCESLETVSISDGLEAIGNYAFSRCEALKSILLPGTLQTIGEYAFSETAIKELIIPSSVTEIGEHMCAESQLNKVVLSEQLTEIPEGAFFNCKHMTAVELPENIKRIGDNAFALCQYIPLLELPDGLESIGTEAFYGTYQKSSGSSSVSVVCLSVPKSVKRIGEKAFAACGITSIAFMPGCEAKLEDGALGGNPVQNLYIPASVKKIGRIFKSFSFTFYKTDKVNEKGEKIYDAWGDTVEETVSVTGETDQIPEGMTMFCEPGSAAFRFARENSVKCAEYESNLPRFTEAFQKQLEEEKKDRVEFERNREKAKQRKAVCAEDYTREECLYAEDVDQKAKEFVVPARIKVIKKDAFSGGKCSCEKVTFEKGSQLVYIEDKAFIGNRELNKIHFPASLRKIGRQAFDNCVYLSEIKFAPGCQLEIIEALAFNNIANLYCNTIVLPSGVKYIGWRAFYGGHSKKIKVPHGCEVDGEAFDAEYDSNKSKVIWTKGASGEGDSIVQKIADFFSKFKK